MHWNNLFLSCINPKSFLCQRHAAGDTDLCANKLKTESSQSQFLIEARFIVCATSDHLKFSFQFFSTFLHTSKALDCASFYLLRIFIIFEKVIRLLPCKIVFEIVKHHRLLKDPWGILEVSILMSV